MNPESNLAQYHTYPEWEEQQRPSFLEMIKEIIVESLHVLFVSVSIFGLLYLLIFQPNQISGTSMVPTFQDKDYILTDKVTYRWIRQPERGDIIVFRSPTSRADDFIKRIIGLPGEKIMIKGGRVYINNMLLKEPYLPPRTITSANLFLREAVPYLIPEGGYIVLGDNRPGSSDSRTWGPITRKSIIGRAWFRYWPVNKMGLVSNGPKPELVSRRASILLQPTSQVTYYLWSQPTVLPQTVVINADNKETFSWEYHAG